MIELRRLPLAIILDHPMRERSGEGSGPGPSDRPKGGTVRRNALSPDEAVALSRRIRAMTAGPHLPDSTPDIRRDRETR